MNSIERHEAFIAELRENLQRAKEAGNAELVSFYLELINEKEGERSLIEEREFLIRRILNMR